MSDKQAIEALIAQASLGNQGAFSQLYDATSAKLFSVCLRVLKDESIAEETLQECYVKVWHKAKDYRSIGLSPMTWLITIARNTAIDQLRKQRVQPESIDDTGREFEDSRFAPEHETVTFAEQKQVTECLDTLENSKAEAVRLAYLEGYSYADLATNYQVPINTMRTWLRRSLLKLRRCMSHGQ